MGKKCRSGCRQLSTNLFHGINVGGRNSGKFNKWLSQNKHKGKGFIVIFEQYKALRAKAPSVCICSSTKLCKRKTKTDTD
jgi:hypothetical protein